MLESSTDNPMQPENLANAPRCGAKTRSGKPCQSPAVRGRNRCRMHGGTNGGAPKGNRNAWKHGNRSAEAESQLKTVKAIDRDLRLLVKIRTGISLRSDELDRLIELSIGKIESY
ncbi:HGGxSTG domain-containing protein [Sphingobium sp. Ant17]|uniref:HGGxSTG domain-containing protein n=1 Tax=Sphingobium sp. Ant17 TaxID=1461752 RepID=UPI001268F706